MVGKRFLQHFNVYLLAHWFRNSQWNFLLLFKWQRDNYDPSSTSHVRKHRKVEIGSNEMDVLFSRAFHFALWLPWMNNMLADLQTFLNPESWDSDLDLTKANFLDRVILRAMKPLLGLGQSLVTRAQVLSDGEHSFICHCLHSIKVGQAVVTWLPDLSPRNTYAPSANPGFATKNLTRSSRLAQMDKGRMQLPSFVRAVLIKLSW